MKYANGNLFIKGKQTHAFVCAKTHKRMLEMLDGYYIDHSYFYNYWSKCGNDKMKEVAKDKEGIWIEEKRLSGEYKPLIKTPNQIKN